MTSTAAYSLKVRDWRVIIFRVVGGLVSLFFLGISAYTLLWPWVIVLPEDLANPEAARWYAAQWGVLSTIMTAIPLIAILRRPREYPMLMQYWALGNFVVGVAYAVLVGFQVDIFILILILLAAYPAPAALLAFKPQGRVSRPLLLLTLLTAVALAPEIWKNLSGMLASTSPQAIDDFGHTLFVAAWMIFASGLAATKRAGWKVLSSVVGVALIYEAIIAFSLPSHPGSWGLVGGALALLGGLAYLVVTGRERDTPDYARAELAA